MNSPSVRDLESIDHETISGKNELRSILENGFQVDPILVDWILVTVTEQNQKIRYLESDTSLQLIQCSCCGNSIPAVDTNAAWLCEECAIKLKAGEIQ